MRTNQPAFSYLEPVWVSYGNGPATTSYHPGTDLVPAEVQLNTIYEALSQSPNWDRTLFLRDSQQVRRALRPRAAALRPAALAGR